MAAAASLAAATLLACGGSTRGGGRQTASLPRRRGGGGALAQNAAVRGAQSERGFTLENVRPQGSTGTSWYAKTNNNLRMMILSWLDQWKAGIGDSTKGTGTNPKKYPWPRMETLGTSNILDWALTEEPTRSTILDWGWKLQGTSTILNWGWRLVSTILEQGWRLWFDWGRALSSSPVKWQTNFSHENCREHPATWKCLRNNQYKLKQVSKK